jgi:hypothetical protein
VASKPRDRRPGPRDASTIARCHRHGSRPDPRHPNAAHHHDDPRHRSVAHRNGHRRQPTALHRPPPAVRGSPPRGPDPADQAEHPRIRSSLNPPERLRHDRRHRCLHGRHPSSPLRREVTGPTLPTGPAIPRRVRRHQAVPHPRRNGLNHGWTASPPPGAPDVRVRRVGCGRLNPPQRPAVERARLCSRVRCSSRWSVHSPRPRRPPRRARISCRSSFGSPPRLAGVRGPAAPRRCSRRTGCRTPGPRLVGSCSDARQRDSHRSAVPQART